MTNIIQYNEKYRKDVELICMNTGPGECFTNEKVREYILLAYCRYYIEKEPDSVFLLVDENDCAQGYIFGSEDFKKYIKGFKPYLKEIGKTGLKNQFTALAEIIGHAVFSKKYPAHLHINLNEDFRRNGNGTRLMQALCSHMKQKNVKGIMLITASCNTPAISFYRKNNFRTLASLKLSGAEIMAKEL